MTYAKNPLVWLIACILLITGLTACDSSVTVVVATPIPPDATFRTYRHPNGLFTLRLPPDWSVRDVSQGDTVRVEFSPPDITGLPLSVYIVNTGKVLDTQSFLDEINRYQSIINGDKSVYAEISRTAQGDGSWRIAGIRQTPIGTRQLNTFLQWDKTFISALEVDITGVDDAELQTYRTVINTFRIDPTVVINASNIVPPNGPAANSGTGALAFDGSYSWTDPKGVFIINGLVTNISGTPLEAVRVTAIFYDAQDNVLGQQQVIVPEDVLEDGTQCPFSIRFQNGRPSQAVRYELQGVARVAEYNLKTHLGMDSFLLGNQNVTYNPSGLLVVSGDVVNKTQAPEYAIKALVSILDGQQRVVATDNVFLSKQSLAPGEVGHFEVTFFEMGGTANRFIVKVDGSTTEAK